MGHFKKEEIPRIGSVKDRTKNHEYSKTLFEEEEMLWFLSVLLKILCNNEILETYTETRRPSSVVCIFT